jgi:light-regulated signal transduction histidine kinase (bacteriophytochrome)
MSAAYPPNLSDQTAGTGSDLSSCDAEPIHIPSSVQPPGVLLVVRESDQSVLQASANAEPVSTAPSAAGRTLADFLPRGDADRIARMCRDGQVGETPVMVPAGPGLARTVDVVVHRWRQMLVVELDPATEPDDDLYRIVGEGFPSLSAATTVEALSTAASDVVRRVTGFDRVMVYRFDRDWNGQVTGESLAAGVEPWLGLRYPASDIPAQARAMYVHSRTRLIADVNYAAVPILPVVNPDTGTPVDLTHAVNRSVSPIHLQYLRNMGVGASMSISIVSQDKLWGMILCHHPTARRISHRTRVACDVLAQNLSLHLAVRENSRDFGKAIELKSVQARLLEAMTGSPDLFEGLCGRIEDLCNLGGGDGVAICADRVTVHGQAPGTDQIAALVDWLSANITDDVWRTDSLPLAYDPAARFKHDASGVLAVSVSRTRKWWVLWFRAEVFRTRYWAGDPRKPAEIAANGIVVRPRTDFARWKQTLESHAVDWEKHHVDAVSDLRNAAVGIVLRQAEERARLSNELERSNKELEAFSYSVSHDLRAPFRHIVGFSDLLGKRNRELDATSQRYLATIANAARLAGTLVDSLLTFSQMGRAAMRVTRVDLNDVVADVRAELAMEIGNRSVEWDVGRLPPVAADPMMVRVVVRNLLSNAVKYTRERSTAHIAVRYCGVAVAVDSAPVITERGMHAAAGGPLLAFEVSDDGAGFDMRYADKLFGVFQRLHNAEDFEGTGIGLANVRRIVERHGGRIGATGVVNGGATFRFSLPGWRPVETGEREGR